MTIVLHSNETVDDLVASGVGACADCGGRLRRWGNARWRSVREPEGERRYRPPRVRCADCRVTHVVLPPDVLVRRRDSAAVIGRAWRAFAGGHGARRVAAALGVPMETVRGWLRRLRRLERPGGTAPTGDVSDVPQLSLASWDARAAAAGCRGEGEIWRFVSHGTQGRLLRNTS